MTKGHYRPEIGLSKGELEVSQLIGKNFTAFAQGVNVAPYVRFDPNRRPAVFWQNAALNLRHCYSSKKNMPRSRGIDGAIVRAFLENQDCSDQLTTPNNLTQGPFFQFVVRRH
jgi:hypothetical protein